MVGALEKLRELRAASASVEEIFEAPAIPLECEVRQAEDPAAAAVLLLLSASVLPLPHPQIVRLLSGQGFGKDAAKAAIGRCQVRGWIEHNLTTGYVLCGTLGRSKA